MTSASSPTFPVPAHGFGAAILLLLLASLIGGFVRSIVNAPPSTIIEVTAPSVNAFPAMR